MLQDPGAVRPDSAVAPGRKTGGGRDSVAAPARFSTKPAPRSGAGGARAGRAPNSADSRVNQESHPPESNRRLTDYEVRPGRNPAAPGRAILGENRGSRLTTLSPPSSWFGPGW